MVRRAAGPRIALIVDNPYRDLPGLTLVAWRLCQMGATCFLVPVNLARREVWPLAPDFVLLNYLRTVNEDFARQLMEANIAVGVLDTEGSIFSPVPAAASQGGEGLASDGQPSMFDEYAITMARDAAARRGVAAYCAWSAPFARHAAQAGWYRPEQIVVTGSPRLDFYAAPWREAARLLSPHAAADPPPLVLINSSFTLANPQFNTPEEELEMQIRRFNYNRSYAARWQQTQGAAMRGLVELANNLARRFPNVTFVFRPHPFENLETYKALLEPFPNLRLRKEGTVEGWLLRAKALIHWGSSTAVEASLLGVPVFTGGWIPTHLPVPIVDGLSVKCPGFEALAASLSAALKGAHTPPANVKALLAEAIEASYYRIDGLAQQRLADAIWRVTAEQTVRPNFVACQRRVYFSSGNRPRRKLAGLGSTVRMRLGLSPRWSFRRFRAIPPRQLPWDESEKRFTAAQCQTILDAIGAVAPGLKIQALPAAAAQAYRVRFEEGRTVALLPSK